MQTMSKPLLLLLHVVAADEFCVHGRFCKVVELPFNRSKLLGTCLFSYCALEEEENYTLAGWHSGDCGQSPLHCLLV